MEEWKTVEDRPNYSISNIGRIRNDKTGLILRTRFDKDGYKDIGLDHPGKKRIWRRIHRLVANAFLPNPKNYPIVNHINGIKDDNRVENLEWCDNRYNIIHAYETGLYTNVTPILVRDLKTNEVSYVRSLKHFARRFADKSTGIRSLLAMIKSSNARPIFNRYIVSIKNPDEIFVTPNTKNFGHKLYVFDHTTGILKKYNSISHAVYETEIRFIPFNKTTWVAHKLGYTFAKDVNKIDRFVYKSKLQILDILQARKEHILTPHLYQYKEYYLFDYINQKEYSLQTLSDGVKIISNRTPYIKIDTVFLCSKLSASLHEKRVKIWKGFGISRKYPKIWPELAPEQILESIKKDRIKI